MISQRSVGLVTLTPTGAFTAAVMELMSEGKKVKESKKRFNEEAYLEFVDAATAKNVCPTLKSRHSPILS
jgi:hypothetical protein